MISAPRIARRGIVLSAFLLAGTAWGQSANISPPPDRYSMTPGGVDMRSGRYVYNQTDLMIGSEGGGLSLNRTLNQLVVGHNNPFGNFSHNWEIMISEKRINITQGLFDHGIGYPDYEIAVAADGVAQTYRAYGTSSWEYLSGGWSNITHTGARDSSGAVYTLLTGDGTTRVFRPMGSNDCSSNRRCAYIDYMVRADGTRFDFDYDDAGGNATKLLSIVSNRGYALVFEYNGGGQINKACLINLAVMTIPSGPACPSGVPTATYSYTTVGSATKLASAVDASGGTWAFGYTGTTMSFTRPGETSPWLTNTTSTYSDDDGLTWDIIGSQSFADGSSFAYSFNTGPFIPGRISPIAGGSYTDNLGRTVTLDYFFPIRPYDPANGHGYVSGESPFDPPTPMVYQITPGPTSVTDQLGRVTTIDYCDPTAMANLPSNYVYRCLVMPVPFTSTTPEGIRTEMTWNIQARHLLRTRQIARPVSGGGAVDDIVNEATYDCSLTNFRFCDSPVTRTDPNGYVNNYTTNYTYDPAHGGVLTVTLPEASSGAPRPQTRNSYTLRKAWIWNGSTYVQPSTGVYLLTSTSTCRTSAANPSGTYAPCSVAGDEVVTQYDYGPDTGAVGNNLLLRGQAVTSTDGGVPTTLRTCYTYDPLGRRISETRPNANLTSCP